jgi:hypothetical protein
MPLTIREKVLKEIVRVTRPDGTIVIVDYALPENQVGRFLIYHLIRLYEGKYYAQFMESDLEALLRKTGVEITGSGTAWGRADPERDKPRFATPNGPQTMRNFAHDEHGSMALVTERPTG